MRDAVVVPCCGNSFDLNVLQTALKVNKNCPCCREDLTNKKLIPNILLRKVANIFQEDVIPTSILFKSLLNGTLDTITTTQIEESIIKTPIGKIQQFFKENISEKNGAYVIEEKILTPLEDKIKPSAFNKLARALDKATDELMREKINASMEKAFADFKTECNTKAEAQQKSDAEEKRKLKEQRDAALHRSDVALGTLAGVGLMGAGILLGGAPIICATAAGDMLLGGTVGAAGGEVYNRRRDKS
jgi:hypothetical protein